MKCPKCYDTGSKSDACFCHNCGNQLKKKINAWVIFFAVLFVVAGGVAIYFYSEFESKLSENIQLQHKNSQLQGDNTQLENGKKFLTEEINAINKKYDDKYREINNENVSLNWKINNLENKLPQEYRIVSGAKLYYKDGLSNFVCLNYSYQNTFWADVYKFENGYGLVSEGYWIKKSDLKER